MPASVAELARRLEDPDAQAAENGATRPRRERRTPAAASPINAVDRTVEATRRRKFIVIEDGMNDEEQNFCDYVTGDLLRMWQTGCMKCGLPIGFIYLAMWAPTRGTVQEQIAQIAGGLLLYTWAFGCMAPIQDKINQLVLPGVEFEVRQAERDHQAERVRQATAAPLPSGTGAIGLLDPLAECADGSSGTASALVEVTQLEASERLLRDDDCVACHRCFGYCVVYTCLTAILALSSTLYITFNVWGDLFQENEDTAARCTVRAGISPAYTFICDKAANAAGCSAFNETCVWIPERPSSGASSRHSSIDFLGYGLNSTVSSCSTKLPWESNRTHHTTGVVNLVICDCLLPSLAAADPSCPRGYSWGDLMPFMIGFALDGIVLVLLEDVEDLFGFGDLCRCWCQRDSCTCSCHCGILCQGTNETEGEHGDGSDDHKDNLMLERWIQVAVTPILFSVDNFLAGGAINEVIHELALQRGFTPISIYSLCAACTVVGVHVAMLVHFFTQLLVLRFGGKPAVRFACELIRIGFLLVVTLSFLDNSLGLIQTGLTVWVALGVCLGWGLDYMEVCCEFLVAWLKRRWRRKGQCQCCT